MTDLAKLEYNGTRIGHIDADILVYAGCAQADKNHWSFDELKEYLDGEIEYIAVEVLELENWHLYISPNVTFRHKVFDQYKANRKDVERPAYIDDAKLYLVETWGATFQRGLEADDLLGIALTDNPDDLLITIDKDLDQVAGWHYNWRHRNLYHVNQSQGDRFLAQQVLTGDRVDNIAGLWRVGPVKADKLLGDEADIDTYLQRCWGAYKDKGHSFNEFAEAYKCLKILTSPSLEWPELDRIQQ